MSESTEKGDSLGLSAGLLVLEDIGLEPREHRALNDAAAGRHRRDRPLERRARPLARVEEIEPAV